MTLYEFADSQDISIEVVKKVGSDDWVASLKTEYDFVHNGFNSQISIVGKDPAEALKNLENYLFDGLTLYLQVGIVSKTKDAIVRRVSIPTLDRIWNS